MFIVALPFAFQVVFVGVLLIQLHGAKIEAEREAHGTAVVGQLNELRKLTEEACLALVMYKKHRKNELLVKFDNTVKVAAAQCVAELQRLTKSDEHDKREVEKITEVFNETAEKLEGCKQNIIDHNAFADITSLQELFQAGFAVKAGVDGLSKKYHNADAERTRSERRRAAGFENTIMALVVADTALALYLITYMSKNVTGRLQTLMENSRRIATGQTLLPALEEEDEISDLDSDFRTMADKLTESQENLYKMTETAMANELNVRSIIENMPLGVLIVDESDLIQMVNTRLEQMFGYRSEELCGKTLTELIPPSAAQHKDKQTNEVRKGIAIKSNESVAQKRSGESFFVEVSVTKFMDTKGKQFLIIIQDVTDRHEMERLKREFVAMVSHDLRTPLTAVQGTLELLVEGTYGDLTTSGSKRVQVASDSIDRLIGLINDLLDIEKMEAGKMRMELRPSDLDKVLSHSLESVRTYAENNQIELEYKPVRIGVIADPDRLIQVVVNFLSNAIKFSEPGQKVIVEADANGDMAEVRVIDFGRGIPASHLDAMFERFKQVKTSDGARKKGTGLGLAISKAIIENHNGKIGVSSVEGKGSTFFFRVPLVIV